MNKTYIIGIDNIQGGQDSQNLATVNHCYCPAEVVSKGLGNCVDHAILLYPPRLL